MDGWGSGVGESAWGHDGVGGGTWGRDGVDGGARDGVHVA